MVGGFLQYYGMTYNPFDKQLPVKNAFESHDHREMTGRLSMLSASRGIGVFTAAPGQGKTFTMRCYAETLSVQLYKVIYICLSTVSNSEFYRQLCVNLGIEPSNRKSIMFRAVQEHLLASYREKRTCILVIDEAHHLSTDTLQDLKMLMNFSYDSLNPFVLVLVGEPLLNRTLDKGIHDALRQRISVHYDFEGLSHEEIEQYIRGKFRAAEASFNQIIGEGVIAAVESAVSGNARMIDKLITNALVIGAQKQMPTFTTDLIFGAFSDLQF